MQLLSKCNKVQVGEFIAVTAEFTVKILAFRNELFDQMLHIHTCLRLLSWWSKKQSTWSLLCAALTCAHPREIPGLIPVEGSLAQSHCPLLSHLHWPPICPNTHISPFNHEGRHPHFRHPSQLHP